MARELGVEARVAYGWAGGQYFNESGMFVFRAREAHSWVEVNLKGYGWVVMEPTPPVVLGGGGAPRVARAGESLPSPEEALTEDVDAYAAGGGHVERVALGLMSGFGLVAAGTFCLRRQGRRERGIDGQDEASAPGRSGYLMTWERACEKKGLRRRPGVTLRRQLEGMEDAPEFARELMGYHYGVRYEEKPPDAESEGRLVGKISEWA